MMIYKIQKRELEKEGMPENEWVDAGMSYKSHDWAIDARDSMNKSFAETHEFRVIDAPERVIEPKGKV